MGPVAAVYHDGRTAVGHAVTLDLEAEGLVIVDEAGGVLDRWPRGEVRLLPGAAGTLPRLAPGSGDARLTLADRNHLAPLLAHCPTAVEKQRRGEASWRVVAGWSLLAVAGVVVLFLVVVPWGAGKLAFALPDEVFRKLGQETERQIIRMLGTGKPDAGWPMVCAGDEGQAVLAGLVERLSRSLDPRPVPTITVVDHEMVNAFALPGDRLLIMRGLLDFVADGDELAGVLAHEIGHIHRRHPAIVFLEQAGTSTVIGYLLGDITGGTVIAVTAQLLVGAAYGREAESEADAIGSRLMRDAGWDATAVGAFLRRVEEKEGGKSGGLAFLSTHPLAEDRAAALGKRPKQGQPALGADELAAVKGMCGR